MTTVNAAGSTGTNGTASSSKGGWGSLGAADFLKMLTAQLQNQDPTAPMDNTQMVAQLAQFSSLSNSTAMNGTLTDISGKLDTLNSSSASNSQIAATLKTISDQLAAIGAAQAASNGSTAPASPATTAA
jgi:flagellar basal-body rod modification protein FlgD